MCREGFEINEKHVISVIVPVYNIAEYLPKCVESIQMQTYKNMQIILVDDGSADESGEICDSYAIDDPRILVLHKKNGGLVTARKAGLAAATGRYIGFVDGDDYIDAAYYENLLHCLCHTGADFVHSGIIAEEGNGVTKAYTTFQDRTITEERDKLTLIQNFILSHGKDEEEYYASILCSKLFEADLIKGCYACVPDHQSFGEDMLAFCRCILKSKKMMALSKTGYHYMIRQNSISHTWNINKFWQESSLYYELCSIWNTYGCFPQMKAVMENYLIIRMIDCMNQLYGMGLGTVRYQLPDGDMFKNCRVALYGAGKVGKDYMSQMILDSSYHIVAWVDNKFQTTINALCLPVDGLKEREFDFVLIAVREEAVAQEIKKQLLDLSIAEEKLIWFAPQEDIIAVPDA